MSVFKYKGQTVMGGNSEADKIKYSNTTSGLESTTVQAAMDEINTKINTASGGTEITYNEEDGHFYITKGDLTKKLGSGEGTATATDVLVGTTFTSEQVEDVTEGTMPNNGGINITLDNTTTSYTIPLGYHNGEGNIQIINQDKTIEPTTSEQIISADTGKVLNTVTINPIQLESKEIEANSEDTVITPEEGKYLSSVTVKAISTTLPTADKIVSGNTIEIKSGDTVIETIEGNMTNNGAYIASTSSNGSVTIPAGYHNGSGYISGANSYNSGYNSGYSAAQKGTAQKWAVLEGYTFTNSTSSGLSGTMSDYDGDTVDATLTYDDNYVYLKVPSAGYYSKSSYLKGSRSSLPAAAELVKFFSYSTGTSTSSITVGTNVKRIIMRSTKQPTINSGIKMGSVLWVYESSSNTWFFGSRVYGAEEGSYEYDCPNNTTYYNLAYPYYTGGVIKFDVSLTGAVSYNNTFEVTVIYNS